MSEYIFVTNIFEYSNIRIYSSHSAQHTSKVDDPEPLPPKLAFLDHFFGENILFRQFDPMNTPKCYTWLESYGSTLKDGKNEKNIFSSCEASDFPGRSRTDFLHDLRLRHIRFDPNPQSLLKGTDLENAPARVYNTNFVRLEYRGLGWYYEHDHRVCWYFELIIWSVGILIGLLVF